MKIWLFVRPPPGNAIFRETESDTVQQHQFDHPLKTKRLRRLRITEKQYENITMITGEPDYQEQTVGTKCHIMI